MLSSQRRQTFPNRRSQLLGGTAPTTRGLVVPIQRPTFKKVSWNRCLQVSYQAQPFNLAGDFVLDVGSGLGVDSFIAAAATGEEVRRIKICDCEVVERGIF